ncbi:hypothetical protein [Thermaurantiacus sp.]
MSLAAALMAGIWTNAEQVAFAREAGRVAPPEIHLRVEAKGGGFEATPLDPYGAATGPARPIAVSGGQPAVPGVELRKARPFRCWAAIPRAAGGWWGARDLPLHDQGGRVRLATDETVPQRFELRLRNIVWPSGPNRPSLVLYIHAPENPQAIAYAWADPGATRVGLNIRSVQASCTLEGA